MTLLDELTAYIRFLASTEMSFGHAKALLQHPEVRTNCVRVYYNDGYHVDLPSYRKIKVGDPFFNVLLNPGHLRHLEEWLNSPVYPGSTETLHSHSAVQMDIIPATGTAYETANAEDGIVLLDERGRDELREGFPDC